MSGGKPADPPEAPPPRSLASFDLISENIFEKGFGLLGLSARLVSPVYSPKSWMALTDVAQF
jgi:hypothetical protein